MTGDAAIDIIFAEWRKAEKKFPSFPDDPVYGVAIMIEEAGESMKAALDNHYKDGSIEDVRTELAQTAAMCIRCLIMT